jgi:lysozyme
MGGDQTEGGWTVSIIEDLKRDEGVRLKPYRCTAGKLTIGIGRNLDDIGISMAEAEMLLTNDIAVAKGSLDQHIPWWRKHPVPIQDCLINMVFNMGWPRLSGFKNMLTALEKGNYAEAADHALDSAWAKQVGDRAKRITDIMRAVK